MTRAAGWLVNGLVFLFSTITSTKSRIKTWWASEPPPRDRGRNPYQTWIMLSFIASALGMALFGPSPAAVVADLPSGVQAGIGVLIVAGAVISLVGTYLVKENMFGAFTEMAGQFTILGPILVYVINLQVSNVPGGFGAAALFCILVAVVHREFQLFRWIRWNLRRHIVLTQMLPPGVLPPGEGPSAQ